MSVACADRQEAAPLLVSGVPAPTRYGTCSDEECGSQGEQSGTSSEDLSYKPESDQEFAARKKKRQEYTWRQLLFLGMLAFVTMTSSLSVCIFPPFFPRIAESKGFGASIYGAIIGTNCLVSFMVTPLLGRHIETIGIQFALVSGVWASGVACILCGMLEMFPPGMAFVYTAIAIRTVQSIGNACIIITTFTYTSLQFPRSTGIIFALNRTVMSVAQMFGPALGGIFYELGGYYTPFVVFGLLHLTATIPLLCVLSDRRDASSSNRPKRMSGRFANTAQDASIWRILRIPSIWVAFTTFLVSTMSTGFLSITLEAQILRKYELSHVLLGMMFGLKDCASTVASPIWGLLCDKLGSMKCYIAVTSLSAAFCFALFGPTPGLHIHQSLWMLIAGLSLYGVAIGGMQVSAVVDALKEASDDGLPDNATTNGVVAGLWNSLSGAGRFVSRCGAGIVIDAIGFPLSSSIIVLLHLGMTLYSAGYVCVGSDRRRRSGRKPTCAHGPLAPGSPQVRRGPAAAGARSGGRAELGSSEALQVPAGRSRYSSEGPLTYLTRSVPDCAGSYHALMSD